MHHDWIVAVDVEDADLEQEPVTGGSDQDGDVVVGHGSDGVADGMRDVVVGDVVPSRRIRNAPLDNLACLRGGVKLSPTAWTAADHERTINGMLMRCTRPLQVVDPWTGPTRLLPGRSYVDSEHVFVRLHPDAFVPAPERSASRSSVIRSGGTAAVSKSAQRSGHGLRPQQDKLLDRPYGLELWRLYGDAAGTRMSLSWSRTRVRLASSAHGQLDAILERDGDQVETGGLLFGFTHPDLVEVVRVSDCGPSARRTACSFQFDPGYNRQRRAEAEVAGLAEIGEWHSHPVSCGSPSPPDLQGFQGRRRALDLDRYLALLAVRVRDGWTLTGWVVTYGLCERATVVSPGR